jgi:hypothetical protein
MKRLIIAMMALVVLMLSCKGRQTAAPLSDTDTMEINDTVDTTSVDSLEQLITDTPMPQAADELFDDFLFNFVANKRLQMERVAFPLMVTRNGDTTRTQRPEWQMERFFMRQGYYTLLFGSKGEMSLMNDTSLTQAVVEKIYFNTGAVIQYQFHRLRGAWMLTEVDTQPLTANPNASFLEFYHQFVTDSVFQCQSLEETVQFVGPDPDDDFHQMEGFLTPDSWPAFAPELPDKMLYNIVYGPRKPRTDNVIFMLRGIANGLELELTFRKHGEKWKLSKMIT